MKRNLAIVFAGLIGISRAASAGPRDPYADRPSIQLSLSGAIDAKDVGDALSKELGLIVHESGDVCAAPCLTIMVSDRDAKATIVFAATSGSIRQRTVTLGGDRAEWPTIITLLAGNVVRDEAADVIALVPAKAKAPKLDMPSPVDAPEPPPAPEQIAEAQPDPEPGDDAAPVVVAPPRHVESRTFAIGLVPVIGTDLTNLDRSHFLSLSIIAGVSAGSTGLAIAGVTDIESDVSGVQLSGVASLAERMSGFQISGVASIGERVSGFQLGGAAAVADDLSGVQIGGAAAVADHVSGAQFAGAVAVSDGGGTQIAGAVGVSHGNAGVQIAGASVSSFGDADIQIAGAVAVAGGDANVQIGGAVSVSESADVQIAGAVNVTGHVTGLQIAPINVAGCVEGLQIGVINIGGCGGDSIGLINIVRGGRYDVEASVDSNQVGTLLLRHGGRHFHNVYGVGGHPVKRDDGMPNNDVWMYGAGLGPTIRIGSTILDLEAIVWQVNHGAHHEDDLSLLAQGRATLGIPLGFITLVAGGAINTYVSTDAESPFTLERSSSGDAMDKSNRVRTTVWPSAFVGIRL